MQQICPQAVPPQPNQWTAGRPAAHRLFGIRAQKTPQEKPRPEQKYPRDQRKIIRRIEARAGQAKRKQKRHAVQLARQLKQLQLANAQISIGTLRRNKNNTKEAMAPGSAGARSRKRRSSALSSTAAPIKCRTPNSICSDGITSIVTAVSRNPQPNVTAPRRTACFP